MKRTLLFLLTFLLVALLAACGGGGAQPATSSPTAATSDDGAAEEEATQVTEATQTPLATSTPDNTVATPEADALNDSFATAITLGEEPVEGSINESVLYYSLEVPDGGVAQATLAVDDGSPAPIHVTLYDANQNYLEEITVPVGEEETLDYLFRLGGEGSGQVFLALDGEATFTLQGQGITQDDGGSGTDAGADSADAVDVEGEQVSGTLGDQDGDDYYAFEVPTSGGLLELSLEAADDGVSLTIYDADGNYVNEASTEPGSDPAVTQNQIPSEEGGRWFVDVRGSGAYTLDIGFTGQDDAGSGGDVGDDAESAFEIDLGEHTGLLGGDDGYDAYTFELPTGGGILDVTAEPGEGDIHFVVYDADGNYVTEAAGEAGDEAATARHVLAGEQGGAWSIIFDGDGAYTFSIAFEDQDDAGSGGDAPDTQEEAVPFNVDEEVTGFIGGADGYDVFATESSAGAYTLTLTTDGEEPIHIVISDADGNYVTEGTTEEGELELPIEATTDGFAIQLDGGGEGAAYTFTVAQ
ncbi:MAG TPA: hypothetical protein VF707_12380 [Ardenticatenaceae bacterium]|jgi:hypothetical protein